MADIIGYLVEVEILEDDDRIDQFVDDVAELAYEKYGFDSLVSRRRVNFSQEDGE